MSKLFDKAFLMITGDKTSSMSLRVFNTSAFVASLSLILLAIVAWFSGLGPLSFWSYTISAIVYCAVFFASKFVKQTAWLRGILLFNSIFLLNFFWFTQGGINGIIPISFVFCSAIFTSFLQKRFQVWVLVFMIINIGGLILAQYYYPTLITPVIPLTNRFVMIFLIAALSIFFVALIIRFLREGYELEKGKLRQQQELLKASEESLRHKTLALQKMNHELVRAKEVAEKSSMAKSEFLSMMSHEIRTPLNAVIGMSHILMMEDPKREQIENLQILKFSSENLLVIINDILDFSKIEAGKIELEEIDLDLRKMVNSIFHGLKFKAEEKGIILKTDFDADLPDIVVGDPTRVSQVLTNLISNAVKFTEEGSVTAKIEVLNKGSKNVSLKCSIIDTGIGIPEEKQDSIFQSFVQATSNTTRKYGGTGLGLAITRKLLQLMKTDISIKSEPGKGSAFSFTLELPFYDVQKKAFPTQKSGPDSPRSMAGFRILLAEDNRINVKIACTFLEKWDAEIKVAQNGQELLDLLAQDPDFDLVLMDLQMPVMDGFEATRQIRKNPNPQVRNIPVVALTASAMLEIQDQAFETGMNDYISKPFNPNELYQKSMKYLDNDREITLSA